MRRTVLASLVVVATVAPAFARPDFMVVMRRRKPKHLVLGGFGTAGGSIGDGTVPVVGGGLVASFAAGHGWPWSELTLAVDARVRLVTSFHDTTSLPVDVVARAWNQHYLSGRDSTEGWPSTIFDPTPTQPYLGLGAGVVVPISPGPTRFGPLAVAGVQRWFGDRFGVYAELELRAELHGGTTAQAGANLGLLFSL